ncbi:MAG TPA: lysyl oxidase family protein [Kofleriaceae bacterium]
MSRLLGLGLVSISALGCMDTVEDVGEVDEGSAAQEAAPAGLLPDMRTVVPRHLAIQKQGGVETIRFSNGVANTGEGPLRLRPENIGNITNAWQEILNADGSIASEHLASTFEFHPQHNHWHIDNIALYEVRAIKPDGPLWGSAIKTTFCLIDWYKLDGNNQGRVYWDCATSYQGISPNWVDQYHHSLAGQEVVVTGAPPGTYFLVSTANPSGAFVETTTNNNTAWTSFELSRNKNGVPSIVVTGNSPCENPGMCGEFAPNR